MIVGESAWSKWRTFHKYKPEEEFFLRMQHNHVWPFEDLGNGFFYIRLYSNKIAIGWFFIIIAIGFLGFFTGLVGMFALPLALMSCVFLYGATLLYGNFSMRELIINRQFGYILRIHTNETIIVEQKIRNLYIRLQEKIDTVGVYWYCIILGGYQLDDIHLSKLSNNRHAMRKLGRRLARHMGINYFDVDDTSSLHKIFHYREKSIFIYERDPVFNLLMANDAENNFKVVPVKYNTDNSEYAIRRDAKKSLGSGSS